MENFTIPYQMLLMNIMSGMVGKGGKMSVKQRGGGRWGSGGAGGGHG